MEKKIGYYLCVGSEMCEASVAVLGCFYSSELQGKVKVCGITKVLKILT